MLTGDPHQGNTVLQMRAQELPAGQRLASLGPGLGRQPHMRISGTTGIECHMRSITPMAGGALANTSPFHNLGSGTGLPARSARPRNHPQAGPEIVPHDAFHNGRTEPAPVRQPPGPGAPYRVPPGRAGARPRAARKKGLRGGLPSPVLPGSGPWGRRSASQLSRPLSLPVATPVTRRLVRSSSLDHLADNAQAARRR